jgi:ubiquinone/menaquinone biosynthesis C-methylase UbiE
MHCCASAASSVSFFFSNISENTDTKGDPMNIPSAKLNPSEVVEVYTQTAFIYDLWGTLTETKARGRAMFLAQVKNGEKVVEVAVGTGLTFRDILRANPDGEVVGIDLTPAMLQKAKQKAAQTGHKNYQLIPGDAYHLQFPDGSFDLLVNNFMFDLLPEKDFQTVLAEFKRVLSPAGRVVLVNMTKAWLFYQGIWEGIYHLNPRWLGGCRGVLLQGSLERAGFTNIQRETISQLGFPAEILTATK